jgi:hypothetical protein
VGNNKISFTFISYTLNMIKYLFKDGMSGEKNEGLYGDNSSIYYLEWLYLY